jgi:hypothetical protein
MFLATMAAFLFIGAGMGIDADRRERIPIVTWKRSAEWLSVAAFLASWTAFGLAFYSLRPTNSRRAPGLFAIVISISENALFLLYLGALYET